MTTTRSLLRISLLALALAVTAIQPASGQALPPDPAAPQPLPWIKGPGSVNLRGVADLTLPEGFVFLEDAPARAMLQQLGAVTSGNEIGFIAPASHDWFVVVLFLDFGYLKPESGGAPDAAQALAQLRALEDLANKERESRQRPAVAVAGWDIAPTFDRDNARLEWAIKAETQGRSIINHYITTLGRSGVLKFCLVDQHRLASTTARFRELAANVSFRAGERFSDHVEGDKRAEGGLLSLITGRAQPLPVAASPADSVAAAAATPASHPSSSGVKIELSSDGRRLLLRLFWLLFFSFLALFVGYVFGMLAGVRRHQKALRRRHGVAQPTATRPRAHWLRTAFSLPARAARSVTPSRPSAVRETPAEKEPVSAVLEAGVSALDAHREVVHKHIDGFRYYERLTRDLYRYNS